jgi:hypothetical protein
LFGCESCSLTLGEAHRLGAFEKRVLRRTFGPKRDETIGCWRKLHNEGLHNFYTSPNIITMIKSMRMRWEGYAARMGEMRNAYRILVGKRKEKGQKRPRRGWQDNIKMDLREIVWDDMDCIHLVQDRGQWRALVNTLINLQAP